MARGRARARARTSLKPCRCVQTYPSLCLRAARHSSTAPNAPRGRIRRPGTAMRRPPRARRRGGLGGSARGGTSSARTPQRARRPCPERRGTPGRCITTPMSSARPRRGAALLSDSAGGNAEGRPKRAGRNATREGWGVGERGREGQASSSVRREVPKSSGSSALIVQGTPAASSCGSGCVCAPEGVREGARKRARERGRGGSEALRSGQWVRARLKRIDDAQQEVGGRADVQTDAELRQARHQRLVLQERAAGEDQPSVQLKLR